MEVLIVDDQVSVANGIEKGISWKEIGISRVWKAYHAQEAKEILRNNNIDILLCDIEMPEENGLSLCRWVRENDYDVKCILLTAHAEFEFAREAISLGVIDYILQPAPYEEIQKVLEGVKSRILEKRKMKKFLHLGKQFHFRKQLLLNDMIREWILRGETDGGDQIPELGSLGYSVQGQDRAACALLRILEWRDEKKRLDQETFCFVTGNILQELLEDGSVQVVCVWLDQGLFSCILIWGKESWPEIHAIKKHLLKYVDVMRKLYDVSVAGCLDDWTVFRDAARCLKTLTEQRNSWPEMEQGVFCMFEKNCQETAVPMKMGQDVYIEKIVNYICCNIDQPLQRTDIARMVNLNEDYLSRLFKIRFGVSLKTFIVDKKMEMAKHLLLSTNLPIGVVASKVGYDNFSHFSATYKKYMGVSPQEERG